MSDQMGHGTVGFDVIIVGGGHAGCEAAAAGRPLAGLGRVLAGWLGQLLLLCGSCPLEARRAS